MTTIDQIIHDAVSSGVERAMLRFLNADDGATHAEAYKSRDLFFAAIRDGVEAAHSEIGGAK